jgi:predicted glycosyltransferase
VQRVRVWIDLTNSPHVLVMRPLIGILEGEGHEVVVTARDYAQTLELLERFAIAHSAIGAHRGAHRGAKALGLLERSLALVRFARERGPFDIALGHGSNDISLAATLLRIPSSTAFDYEGAALQHHINCRLAKAVVVPAAIPPERLHRYGAAGKIRAYEGLKEEYYLADFEPAEAVLEELAIDPRRALVVVRTPPAAALYHRFENELFDALVRELASAWRAQGVQSVVLPRTPDQRALLQRTPGLRVPERAVDAQSLIAYASLVISAGGTMNREAVALGTPVVSTFQGALGAVDHELVRSGRMRLVSDPGELASLLADLPAIDANASRPTRVRRDPRDFLALLLSPLEGATGAEARA